jgi:hypothetical protein
LKRIKNLFKSGRNKITKNNMKITGSKIEELTMADLDQQKDCLKILSERDYIRVTELNLEADDPFMIFETDNDDRFWDDINEITDSFV